MNHYSSTIKKYYLPAIGAALASVSLFHFALPTFAAGTAASTVLRNKATATYDDDGDPNTDPLEVISNEVTVTVGKVAGITNVADGNTATGQVLPGDSVGLDFRITNTGNDVSSIFIPAAGDILNNGGTTDNLLSIDSIQFKGSGANDTFAGRSTLTNGIVPNIAVDDFIIVRVNITVNGNADPTETVTVQLGNTGPNDDTADTQNQPDQPASNSTLEKEEEDVRTVAVGSPPAAVGGDPLNGEREASATNSITLGSEAIALAQITKGSSVGNNSTPENIADDVITYNLDLEVLNSITYADPNFNFNFRDLEGRDYSSATTTESGQTGPVINRSNTSPQIPVLSNQTNLILVSDAVPEGTELRLDNNDEPVGVNAPTGWVPIYTQSPLSVPADEAQWFENPDELDTSGSPATIDRITRIGWVYDARAASPGDGAIARGTNVTDTQDFTFQVTPIDNPAPIPPLEVYNLAQIFGSTDDGDDATTTGNDVFDESGDQNPSNFDDGGTIGPDETVGSTLNTDGTNGTTVRYGFAVPGINDENVDPGNNQGTGRGGEVDRVILNNVLTSDILNGPDGTPDARGQLLSGTLDDNHDFQNLSATTPENTSLPAADFDNNGNLQRRYNPAPKEFTNTVRNGGGGEEDVTLLPISPGYGVGNDRFGGAFDDLPDETIVTIEFDGDRAVYVYIESSGEFQLATTSNAPNIATNAPDVTIPGTNEDIVIVDLDANDETYTVTVDLPADTPLSTNFNTPGDSSSGVVGGYPVPILAYAGTQPTTINSASGNDYNVTINQLYTGFLQLDKTATIFRRDDLEDPDSTRTEVTGNAADTVIPGDIIEYEVTYTNISEGQDSGTGNGILTVNDLAITEDGTASGNTWGLDNDTPNPDADDLIDTLHVEGEAVADPVAPINYTPVTGASSTDDSTLGAEIIRYEVGGTDGIDGIAPGDSGTFTFQRRVTEESDIPDPASNP